MSDFIWCANYLGIYARQLNDFSDGCGKYFEGYAVEREKARLLSNWYNDFRGENISRVVKGYIVLVEIK